MADAIGIDIVETARIKRLSEQHGDRFVERILGPEERSLLSMRTDRLQFLAGRFAAKEALIKALGRYLSDRPAFKDLQVLPDEDDRPTVSFADHVRKQLPQLRCLISISHERAYAVAIVILTEEK